ncbi:Anti-sigma regulatory factor (Ser/Thr protein kinase) [Lentzea albidocapillata subsp. violacea]|uniref:Anti-sigma regulatory factor (Ser/Thr protein kinase) n=1 Tax=Lentzea albidocapillata subsp. violacea TaxID=128104 RepID=A0A1G8UIY4_9PSEU|nr:sensor histidine kinase [Lentzea albidocapillata]SDJ53719.1 Anti-sigma regulatory factor (Ser/Thr protein kinase) [Lentzea albidocapillata subsp. violacea]
MTGFFHETAFYGTDDDFLAHAVPFLEDGLRAGEPSVVACSEQNTELLRGALGRTGVIFRQGTGQYSRPSDAIASYLDLFREYTVGGAQQMRVIGQVPHPGTGARWDWWARYEAAVNQAYAEFPVWGLCPYDTRTTPADVLADVVSTHPNIATAPGTREANSGYRVGLASSPPLPDVLEDGVPLVELVDPAAGTVREAVGNAIDGMDLGEDAAHDAVYAASEIVTNGLTHGVAPVRFRLWADGARVVLAVTDHGPGPSDPTAGLVPTTETRSAGLGLWILHRTCDYVSMGRDADGFTVRVSVGGQT